MEEVFFYPECTCWHGEQIRPRPEHLISWVRVSGHCPEGRGGRGRDLGHSLQTGESQGRFSGAGSKSGNPSGGLVPEYKHAGGALRSRSALRNNEDGRHQFTFKSASVMPSRVELLFISFNGILFEQESAGFPRGCLYHHLQAAVGPSCISDVFLLKAKKFFKIRSQIVRPNVKK